MPTSALTSTDGLFLWYVQAVDVEGVTSVILVEFLWRTFSLILFVTLMLLMFIVSVDVTLSVGMLQLMWIDYLGVIKYEVYYGVNGYILGIFGINLFYVSFIRKEVLFILGMYFWGVKVFDVFG